MLKISNENDLIRKENIAFRNIIIVVVAISVILIGNIFFRKNVNISNLQSTLNLIRLFNSILVILAFGSCIISYNRLKNDSIFIISLMYLGLSVGIVLGNIDYFSFYDTEFTLSSYITVSTSLLRIFILLIAILPNNKLRNLIINNKKESIIFVIVYSIIFAFLEDKIKPNNVSDTSEFFIIYNLFLMTVYIMCSLRLFIVGVKKKEYIFVVLSTSIFMLAIKAIYAIYGISIISFNVKLTSVSITYISSLIVIAGAFIELYMYICKTKVLNNKLSVFYNLVDNNKHSFMFICDEKLNILYANKKVKEYYFKSEDVEIEELTVALNEKLKTIDKNYKILKYLNDNEVWRGIIKSESENKTIDCSVQRICIRGEKKEIVISYMDISDEINAELELEKLKVYDKEKNQFISNLSHELRTPLNIFYSTIQLLDKMYLKEDQEFKLQYKKYKKSLYINCNRMLRLTNNVIDISTIDMGMLKANFGNYDIVSIVEEVTLSVVNYALLKSINIQFDTNVEEHIIKCDSNMIERALLNLLSNAIKFSTSNKNIYVNVCVKDYEVHINVKDEGIGICDKSKAHIFERFIQIDKSFNRMNEGSGIGLSIVKSIIDLHSGSINVDSKVNEGSTFKVILPNQSLNYLKPELYNTSSRNTELELSDIYEILN